MFEEKNSFFLLFIVIAQYHTSIVINRNENVTLNFN